VHASITVALALAACGSQRAPDKAEPHTAAPVDAASPVNAASPVDAATPLDAPPANAAQLDPDGDDDPADTGSGVAPTHGHFEKVGTPPFALRRICDLTPLGDALYLAHANSPLGSDGATITRYAPAKRRAFAVAFDWNRRGQPARGGGAGQGFLRVHAIDGRLYVPDADPPYNGLGIVERGTEGYVFVSDRSGTFAPARGAAAPVIANLTRADGKGTGVVPRAYHVLDVIAYRGALFASTGSVPPKERAWRGPSPGALHRANADGSRWLYEVDYPFPYRDGVWRLTYMVRFHDRLYAGIQDYDGRDPNDFIVIDPPGDVVSLTREHLRPVRVTPSGAAGTLRWWVDTAATPHRLYWIAVARDGVKLRVTSDGDAWQTVPLPDDAGRPTDITRFRDTIIVLTERALVRLDGTRIAAIPAPSPFELSDFFCAAPLAVFGNELYAGGQRGGTLYKLVID
jgi:hypothetical protein